MFVTIITDCSDSGTFGRQMTRAASLFGFPPIPVSITPDFEAPSDLEAGGLLIDMLDACRGTRGVVLVNKAPRSGNAKKWYNGTPFGYFWFHQTLVVSSVDGYALSLAKKFNLADKFKIFDIPTVMQFAKDQNLLDHFDADYVVNTQFRSFEFLPRVAKWVLDNEPVPADDLLASDILECPNAVFFVDNFGNLKTTVLPEEVGFEPGKEIAFKGFGTLKCYSRLKDLPNGEAGLVIGSSGLKEKRLLEIMVQGSSAKEKFGAGVGTAVELE
jgi:hypothetical protein